MKRFKSLALICMVLGLLVFLTGCPKPANKGQNKEPLGMVYFTYFDTVSYIYSYVDESTEQFEKNCEAVAAILNDYHQLFDIYHEYSGVTNLATLNAAAGGEWLQVDPRLMDFLCYARELYQKTGGEMNVMMGAVLRPWHDSREAAANDPSAAAIPVADTLQQAAQHIAFDALEIDQAGSRVRITDPDASLDVGALGKGYATEMAAQYLIGQGITGYVLNIGGNIRTIGTKPDGSGWRTGIKDPLEPDTYASYINIADTSCVTSGVYERYFTVDGQRYHHVIDADTLMPSAHFAAVTVITPHSGLADALTTALFCMSYQDGLALLEQFEQVEVLWIDNDGNQYMTDGFSGLLD